MKFSEKWLREWVDPAMSVEDLAHRLTMIGHEVEHIEPHGRGLDGVIVAEVLEVAKHPNADRLRLCQVSDGTHKPSAVVCGAPNARAGLVGAPPCIDDFVGVPIEIADGGVDL